MASASVPVAETLLAPDAKPPKSKAAPYYAIHPLWQNVSPIIQADQTGALAAIAYSPRYSEAMSYLRALMAKDEVSERALALTEDLISMNPAHYTVWIYRMRVLRDLWKKSSNADEGDESEVSTPDSLEAQAEQHIVIDDYLWANVQSELRWLDELSFRNLKNYQIWHHRQSLVDLLPQDPVVVNVNKSESALDRPSPRKPLNEEVESRLLEFIKSEQTFLAQILSLDTKNYHVWSYRQWLCARFPCFLIPSAPHCPAYDRLAPITVSIAKHYRTHAEVKAIDALIDEDVRNNSAWSHRYFILFGDIELNYAESQEPPLILKQVNDEKFLHKMGLVDVRLVGDEIEYTKAQIRRAPQNGSSWNYLRGILGHGDIDISAIRDFCEEFLGPEGDLWMDQWIEVEVENAATGEKTTERREMGVRSSHAVEWLSEIYAQDGTEEGKRKSKECLKALAEKWDIIRKGFWEWKGAQMEGQDKIEEK